ncbi:cupin domain-containing protein [Lentzea aerocolonigenes]|uniref:cupin domain-containing protein n=1 Tax=Lentzea aerocolonigenes TaxID=68170 RepID=UPI0004C2F620|nr:cupin domain-containing protein [Lentzea aerocolonigenes]MCP2242309.1 Cupin domain protein [Lentzea aerocolonigenes]
MAKTVVRQHDEGDAYWVLGGLYEVRVSSDDTNGEMTVMEMTVPAGMGPPPHTHPGSEAFRVLDGTVRVHINDETVEAGPGAYFFFPAGTLETFEPVSDTARVLVTYLPGGIDRFFAEVGEPAASRELPPPSETPPDLERLAAVGERYGMQMQIPERS